MVAKAKPKQNQFRTYADYLKALKAWKRTGPKKKPRRVVLGVGHPWFYAKLASEGVEPRACAMFLTREHQVFTDCPVIDSKGLGNWNKIRLVAEVLK